MTAAHLLYVKPSGTELVTHESSTATEVADAIVAVAAFVEGDHGDEILRQGVYRFHVDETGNGMVGGRVDL